MIARKINQFAYTSLAAALFVTLIACEKKIPNGSQSTAGKVILGKGVRVSSAASVSTYAL
ncbi:MAG: hypothetical protein QNJ47_03240 [Nostocaceae cyanobacterium]|nr:hypothetical protein [Nostocaceae cyanobacterium]